MSTALAYSLSVDVEVGIDRAARDGSDQFVAVAEAILVSPEMQAIKFGLLNMAKASVNRGTADNVHQYLRTYNLPHCVVEWVLS